jgi:hypothetical protein
MSHVLAILISRVINVDSLDILSEWEGRSFLISCIVSSCPPKDMLQTLAINKEDKRSIFNNVPMHTNPMD